MLGGASLRTTDQFSQNIDDITKRVAAAQTAVKIWFTLRSTSQKEARGAGQQGASTHPSVKFYACILCSYIVVSESAASGFEATALAIYNLIKGVDRAETSFRFVWFVDSIMTLLAELSEFTTKLSPVTQYWRLISSNAFSHDKEQSQPASYGEIPFCH